MLFHLKSAKGRAVTVDTEAVESLGLATHGEFGDPAGYSEELVKTPSRRYALIGRGGATSPYPEPSARSLTREEADAWAAENL